MKKPKPVREVLPLAEPINDAIREHAAGAIDWKYADLVEEYHRWCSRFSREFRWEVPTPAVAVGNLRYRRLGQYRTGRNPLGIRHEITLAIAHVTSAPPADVLSTVAHELLHEWQAVHGTPSKHNHHNREFLRRALEIGIVIDQRGTHLGYQPGLFTRLLEKCNVDISGLKQPDFESIAIKMKPKLAGTSKLKLWTCGCTKIRAAVSVFARCMRCQQLFEFADADGCMCGNSKGRGRPEDYINV